MAFIDEEYLLETETAVELYEVIGDAPILDPHSHVDLQEVVANDGWSDIWEVQGATDHYVWELMRKRGVPEERITGDASNKEKWLALAEIFPELVGNPTYEWVHLDLKRRFGIEKRISPETAEEIWTKTKDLLDQPEYKPQALLEDMNVEVMCSTDDPTDDLTYHERAAEELDGIAVKPTWRPDRAIKIADDGWRDFVDELEEARGIETTTLDGFLAAMEDSHDHFDDHGCVASDLGIKQPISKPVSEERAARIYKRAIAGANLDPDEVRDFEAFMLEQIGEWNRETDWVTQLHIGAVRDYRWDLYERLGPDTGGDISTQDVELVDALEYFLNTFDGELDIVLYTVDPTHYPTTATIARAFPNVSLGAAWWFNDSPFGMEQQLQYIGTVDLLSNYAGMVSDSRKLVSYGSRFEMFRRSLANAVGAMVERGQVPKPEARDLVERMAYDRPKELFGF